MIRSILFLLATIGAVSCSSDSKEEDKGSGSKETLDSLHRESRKISIDLEDFKASVKQQAPAKDSAPEIVSNDIDIDIGKENGCEGPGQFMDQMFQNVQETQTIIEETFSELEKNGKAVTRREGETVAYEISLSATDEETGERFDSKQRFSAGYDGAKIKYNLENTLKGEKEAVKIISVVTVDTKNIVLDFKNTISTKDESVDVNVRYIGNGQRQLIFEMPSQKVSFSISEINRFNYEISIKQNDQTQRMNLKEITGCL